MKKAILFTMVLFTFAGLFAQFGPPRLVSPELKADSITFRFRAPKAIRVELNGDFLPKKPMKANFGTFDMPAPARFSTT